MNYEQEKYYASERKAIDLLIKLVLVLLLITWSGMVIFPFFIPVLWGCFLAITIYPLYKKLLALLTGKKSNAIASTLITLLLLCILLIPTIVIVSAIIQEIQELKDYAHNDSLIIPAPDKKVESWPIIGKKLYEGWSLASKDLDDALLKYHDQLTAFGQKMFDSVKSVFSNILSFSLSIIISGILLAYSEDCERSALIFSNRLMGSRGAEFKNTVTQIVRNVSKGILGVAFIQFLIMGICFMLAGVPFAGLWAIFVFLLALIQLPTFIVAVPVIIYLYSAKETGPATMWSILILLAGLSDNVLKPLLMGKGAPVPMLVIFLGAIGGFMLSGFIGLFTGAIILSVAYKLMTIWVQEPPVKTEIEN